MAIFGATKRRLMEGRLKTPFSTSRGKRTDLGKDYIGSREVAKALSKSGITVSQPTVSNLLSIHDNLVPELKA